MCFFLLTQNLSLLFTVSSRPSVHEVLFITEVCGRIRNFTESNGKPSEYSDSSLQFAQILRYLFVLVQ